MLIHPARVCSGSTGDLCQVQCDEGYAHGTLFATTCEATGDFAAFECAPKPCANLPIQHTKAAGGSSLKNPTTCSGVTGDVCEYSCADGSADSRGTGQTVCGTDGAFEPALVRRSTISHDLLIYLGSCRLIRDRGPFQCVPGPEPVPEPEPVDHCPQALFDSKVAQMATTCCGDGACNTLPSSCSDECRSFYLMFYQACWSTRMQKHPNLMAGFSGLHDLCSRYPAVEPAAEPVSACAGALFATSINLMGLKCCPTDVDCDPPPTVCSAECAAFYVPFHAACSQEMTALGPDQEAVFNNIYVLCTARGH